MKLFTLFQFFLNVFLFGQNTLTEQFSSAQKLYNDGKYFDAVTEFKRLVFFDSSGTFKPEAEYYTGICYKKGGLYSNAIGHLVSARISNQDPDLSYKISVEIIKCNILRRSVRQAFQEIYVLEAKAYDDQKRKEINILKAFAYVFSDDWKTASVYFGKAGYEKLSDVCLKTSDKLYSETKANILSVIIPGAGQIYTGNYVNGIISFVVNALTLYLTINAFAEDRIFDGIVTGNYLWYRFYTGNISNAKKFVREENRVITNNALGILQDFTGYRLD